MLVPFTRNASPARRRMEKAGAAAFLFFLIKGVFWLALAAAALWR